MSKIAVIGSGFASMSAAAYLAKAGHSVEVFEKNSAPGGRASVLKSHGYTFDMGPSWYWMPDIIDDFFSDFGSSSQEQLKLSRLDPSYRVFFPNQDLVDVPADYSQVKNLFEKIESGAGRQLDDFLESAKVKYDIGIKDFASLPANNFLEYLKPELILNAPKMQLFGSYKKMVDAQFSNEKLRMLLYFPILFLGVSPERCPAMYSLMNYADVKLGTWYPKGGMYSLVEAIHYIAAIQGVTFHFNSEVEKVNTDSSRVSGITVSGQHLQFDAVVAGADYQHVDQHLLERASYSKSYWNSRVMSPSSLLFFVGVNKRLDGLEHHNLFFDSDLSQHGKEIYDTPQWPSDPLFYVCCPSKTDPDTAPSGKENLFILMPLAPGLEDTEELREHYKKLILTRLEERLSQNVSDHIEFERSYCLSDFKEDYNSFKGNAYGLANTLKQTAFFKPKIRNKSFRNLYHCGQLTTPGPGVPPALMSGKIAAMELLKDFLPLQHKKHETTF